jgi:hypothetical protein
VVACCRSLRALYQKLLARHEQQERLLGTYAARQTPSNRGGPTEEEAGAETVELAEYAVSEPQEETGAETVELADDANSEPQEESNVEPGTEAGAEVSAAPSEPRDAALEATGGARAVRTEETGAEPRQVQVGVWPHCWRSWQLVKQWQLLGCCQAP